MERIELWEQKLAKVIFECVHCIEHGDKENAAAWISLEEEIGYKETVELWKHSELGPIAKSLEYCCFAAEHDRNILLEEISLEEMLTLLKKVAIDLSENKKYYFDERFNKFK